MRHRLLILPLLLIICVSAVAQQTQQTPSTDGVVLSVESLFTYRGKPLGPVRWQSDSSGYFALEPSTTKRGSADIVRYAAATGERTVFVAAEKLTPAGATSPLSIEDFDFSEDGQKLLIFTDSADLFAAPWNTTSILLPSGSSTKAA